MLPEVPLLEDPPRWPELHSPFAHVPRSAVSLLSLYLFLPIVPDVVLSPRAPAEVPPPLPPAEPASDLPLSSTLVASQPTCTLKGSLAWSAATAGEAPASYRSPPP